MKPNWPFDEFGGNLPEQVASDLKDTRERLAARITSSRRFAEVMANRLWKRLMGAGLVEKVDDWEGKTPSDPAPIGILDRRIDPQRIRLQGLDPPHHELESLSAKGHRPSGKLD